MLTISCSLQDAYLTSEEDIQKRIGYVGEGDADRDGEYPGADHVEGDRPTDA